MSFASEYHQAMPKLSDITKASVNLAVAEYDRLEREEFLRINGFGRAETYFLKRGRRFYESKAIVGCAYGYEHPMEGHLRSSQFSGGESRVKALLTRLGFKVVPDVSSLLHPKQLCSRDEFLSRPCPVPARKGVYAWYFREPPPGVPVAGCWKHDGYTLLYVGIAPDKLREGRWRGYVRGFTPTSPATLRRHASGELSDASWPRSWDSSFGAVEAVTTCHFASKEKRGIGTGKRNSRNGWRAMLSSRGWNTASPGRLRST
jgi:hypothetical protein